MKRETDHVEIQGYDYTGSSILSLPSDIRTFLLLKVESFDDLCVIAQSNRELRKWLKNYSFLEKWLSVHIGPNADFRNYIFKSILSATSPTFQINFFHVTRDGIKVVNHLMSMFDEKGDKLLLSKVQNAFPNIVLEKHGSDRMFKIHSPSLLEFLKLCYDLTVVLQEFIKYKDNFENFNTHKKILALFHTLEHPIDSRREVVTDFTFYLIKRKKVISFRKRWLPNDFRLSAIFSIYFNYLTSGEYMLVDSENTLRYINQNVF
jgi:hypothetical protein